MMALAPGRGQCHPGLLQTLTDNGFAASLYNTGTDKQALGSEFGVPHAFSVILQVMDFCFAFLSCFGVGRQFLSGLGEDLLHASLVQVQERPCRKGVFENWGLPPPRLHAWVGMNISSVSPGDNEDGRRGRKTLMHTRNQGLYRPKKVAGPLFLSQLQ
jgi:hypothetical protein